MVVMVAGMVAAMGSRIPMPPSVAGKCMSGIVYVGIVCCCVMCANKLCMSMRIASVSSEFQWCKVELCVVCHWWYACVARR